MGWLENIREYQIRVVMTFLIGMAFIMDNWGTSSDALQHVFLSVRTHHMQTLSGDVIRALDETIIPFGKTTATFLIYFVTWLLLNSLIKLFNPDTIHIEFENKKIREENAQLRTTLSNANASLFRHITTIEQLSKEQPFLERHYDRIVELKFASQMFEKEIKSADKNSKSIDFKAPDLFQTTSRKSKSGTKSPARRRTKPPVKF